MEEIKKFNDFSKKKEKEKKKKEKDFEKKKSYNELSDDLSVFTKLDDGSYEKAKEPVNILQITGMLDDPEEIKKVKEAFTLDTSVVVRNIKRGDIIWLTAILEKSTGHAINSQSMGVVEVRVVNYYYGLSKLNTLKRT